MADVNATTKISIIYRGLQNPTGRIILDKNKKTNRSICAGGLRANIVSSMMRCKTTNGMLLSTIFLLLFMFVACKDGESSVTPIEGPINWELKWETYCDDIMPSKKKDILLACWGMKSSFIENFVSRFQCEKVYFIKGIAQDTISKYGLNIKLIKDLKGNFPQDTGEIFTAFGDGSTFIELNRLDYLRRYKEQDTLLMLLIQAPDWGNMVPPDSVCYEKVIDYVTMTCAYSVLKLENDSVIGFILPWEIKEKESNLITEDTISFKYFQKRLQEIK